MYLGGNDLKDKTVVVTGASSGIGAYTVKALGAVGARTLAIGRRREELQALAEESGCDWVAADLAEDAGLEAVEARLGQVDGLVNCAGLALLEPATEVSAEAFDRMMAINARAAALMSRLAAQRMIAQGRGGAIVNVSSQASLIALRDHLGYCASKAALDAITRVLCLELGPHGIRVNSLNPTVTLTPMARVGWSDPAKADALLRQIPLRRFAEPEEVVQPILFLLSQASSMISGVTLPVDGGYTAV